MENPALISAIAEAVGSQSVVVVFDVTQRSRTDRLRSLDPQRTYEDRASRRWRPSGSGALGAGEIVVNAIDYDGTMKGYDLTLAKPSASRPPADDGARRRRFARRHRRG